MEHAAQTGGDARNCATSQRAAASGNASVVGQGRRKTHADGRAERCRKFHREREIAVQKTRFDFMRAGWALVRGGQLKQIGVATEKRLTQFPDVQTVSESGLPGFFFNSWFAILTPAGTPKGIIARLNAEVVKAAGDPEMRRSDRCLRV
jgi:hypothetical protein